MEYPPPRPKKHFLKNAIWPGIVLGIIGPFVGAIIYYKAQAKFSHYTPEEFIKFAYEMNLLGAVLSIGAFVNLLIFLGFIQIKWLRTARALLFTTICYIAVVLILKFFV